MVFRSTVIWVVLLGPLAVPGTGSAQTSFVPRPYESGIVPKKLVHVRADYPEEARAAGVAGLVIAIITIAPDGSVTDAKVSPPAPPGPTPQTVLLMEKAAVSAIRQWKYERSDTIPLRDRVIAVSIPVPASQTDEAPLRGGIPEPERLNYVAPIYVPIAKAAKLEGVVVFEAYIGADGRVKELQVVRSVHWLLDAPAMDAARQWEFKPTVVDGVARPVVMTLTVSFSLK